MRSRELTRQVRQQPRRFYDGGRLPGVDRPAEPPDPGSDPSIMLLRHIEEAGPELWSLERRLAYRDRHLGEILVPADDDFRTDLTSVPALFTWLVPRTGAHLPAALLHDALVAGDDASSYDSTQGRVIDRVEADRIFRDAMADTGTGVIRRWIVWSAVTVATLLLGRDVPWSRARTWSYRVVVGTTIAVILYLGYSATAMLFARSWPLAADLPWMASEHWWVRLLGGGAGAVVVPLALSLLWGRFRIAGAVVGVLLAVLLHVTVGLAAISGVYLALEALARRSAAAAWALAAVVVLTSLVVFGVVSLG